MRCLVLVLVGACVTSSDDGMRAAGPPGHLTVALSGAAVGFVESDPPGIACGNKCDAEFPGGTMVTLVPIVGRDGEFHGWGGACSGTENCTVMIDGDQTLSATFLCTGRKVFNYRGGSETIQTFSAPDCAKHVIIDAAGGEGGDAGGRGAQIRGTFATDMLPGRDLLVLVGTAGTHSDVAGGGGGGSFVYTNVTDAAPLVAAGGGGGSSAGCSGGPGSATQTPTIADGGTGNGTGGSNGGGASGGVNLGGSVSPSGTGGGGAGWLSDGRPGSFGTKGGGGRAPRNGGSGGAGDGPSGGFGGFGGGGGAASSGGASGGGGGYNGGGGGNNLSGNARGCGGGGGSYNGGEDPLNTAGARVGHGLVAITWTD
jgi:hypothetical protein